MIQKKRNKLLVLAVIPGLVLALGIGQTAFAQPCYSTVAAGTVVINAPSSAKVGEDVTFDGSASTNSEPLCPITDYGWSFGDGSTGSGAVVSHAYASIGAFTVTLQVTWISTICCGQVIKSGSKAITIQALKPTFFSPVCQIPSSTSIGQETTFTARIRNTGEVAGTQTIELFIDEVSQAKTPLTLDPSQEGSVTFKYTFAQAGSHSVRIQTSNVGCAQKIDVQPGQTQQQPPGGASDVQEQALLYKVQSPGVLLPDTLHLQVGKVRLFLLGLGGGLDSVAIRNAQNKQILLGASNFSITAGKLTTVEFSLDQAGEYEIISGDKVLGKLTTQPVGPTEVDERTLLFSRTDLKMLPGTLTVNKGKLRLFALALGGAFEGVVIRNTSNKQVLSGAGNFRVGTDGVTTLELSLDQAGEYEIVQGDTVLGKLIVK